MNENPSETERLAKAIAQFDEEEKQAVEKLNSTRRFFEEQVKKLSDDINLLETRIEQIRKVRKTSAAQLRHILNGYLESGTKDSSTHGRRYHQSNDELKNEMFGWSIQRDEVSMADLTDYAQEKRTDTSRANASLIARQVADRLIEKGWTNIGTGHKKVFKKPINFVIGQEVKTDGPAPSIKSN